MVSETKSKIVAYIRVSSLEQNEERQKLLILEKYPLTEKFFIDKFNGEDNRLQLKHLIDYLQTGDTVIIECLSKIARNTKHCYELLVFFQSTNITLISLRENFDFSGATGKLLLNLLSALIQYTPEQKQTDIALAKTRGVYKGRQKIKKPDNFDVLYDRYLHSNRLKPFKLKNFLRETGLKYATLYRFIKDKEKEKEKIN